MSIKTLDFQFRKQMEGFQLDVYPRDSSQPLATGNFTFPRSFLNGTELKQLDFDARDPSGRVERLREFGRRLYQQIFTTEIERIWSDYKQNNDFSVLCIRIAPENDGGLLLEDVRGESRPTSVTEVLQSLQRGDNSLRLVVLSGCQTARTINVGGFRDMARGLLRSKIPAVIAMQFSISDTSGLKFAESFYKSIAAGISLELAVRAARRTLWLSER